MTIFAPLLLAFFLMLSLQGAVFADNHANAPDQKQASSETTADKAKGEAADKKSDKEEEECE